MLRKRSLVLQSLRRFDLSRIVSTSSKPSLFCTTTVQPARLSWEASSQAILKQKLETSLKDHHRVDDAWDVFKDYRRLYGFPDSSIMNRFVTVLSYSSNPAWLRKADDLTRLALKQNSGLVNNDALTKLLLSLARAQMSESACNILRTMLEKGCVLTPDVLRLVVMHMVKTEVGTCLASNYLVQVCHRFVELKMNSNVVKKPGTVLFNLVLGSCVRFNFSLKGQELIELMAKIDVVADRNTIVIMSFVYEMNGMRDELRKLKDCIIPSQLLCHYRRLYDNLLSVEFKFGDVGSAGRLVLDICKSEGLPSVQNLEKVMVLSVGSHHIKSGLKIQVSPKILQRDSSLGVDSEPRFVSYADSKLGVTSKTLAKLVYGYKRRGDIPELSRILFSVGGSKLCADVVDACVGIGWLEAAHDILDDMDSAGNPMDLATYRKVLSGYYKSKMVRNAEVLLRQMTKAGLITDPSDEITVKEKDCENTELRELLVQEISEGEQTKVPSTLHELNTSLYYFCKAKMQVDAVTTYRKIQKMKIPPTVQSFWILIDMYSSLGMYREITVVWGDIKRNMAGRDLEVTQDLLEKLVVNFLRGGYFERVMEVVSCMKEKGMYNDVAMYRDEYLKVHKNLYRKLKAVDAVTEAQAQRVEHVKAFRKLVGII